MDNIGFVHTEYTADNLWKENVENNQQIWNVLTRYSNERVCKDITNEIWGSILCKDRCCRYKMQPVIPGCKLYVCKCCKRWRVLAYVSLLKMRCEDVSCTFIIEYGERRGETYKLTRHNYIRPTINASMGHLWSDAITNHIIQRLNLSKLCSKHNIQCTLFETAFMCHDTITVIERSSTSTFEEIWTLLAPFEQDTRETRVQRLISLLQQIWVWLRLLSSINYVDKLMNIDDLILTRDIASYTYENRIVQGVFTVCWDPTANATSTLVGSNLVASQLPNVYKDVSRISSDVTRWRKLWKGPDGSILHRNTTLFRTQWPSLVMSLKYKSPDITEMFRTDGRLNRVDELIGMMEKMGDDNGLSEEIASVIWS